MTDEELPYEDEAFVLHRRCAVSQTLDFPVASWSTSNNVELIPLRHSQVSSQSQSQFFQNDRTGSEVLPTRLARLVANVSRVPIV